MEIVEPVEPAELPGGFWARVDYMLHNPECVIESMRRGLELRKLSLSFLVISLGLAAIYGAVMGATNLLQWTAMATDGKLLMIVSSAIKVPVLFLLSLVIVVAPVYVLNTFVGPRLSFPQISTVALASTAVMSIVLASTATVAVFFSITLQSYHFIKSLHVVFFVYAALVGLRFFRKSIRAVTPVTMRHRLGGLFTLALVLYAFVGMQLSWVLRPFVGDPDMKYQVFRPRSGSFYTSVPKSLRRGLVEAVQGNEERKKPGDDGKTGALPQSDSSQDGVLQDNNGAAGPGREPH
ncbi:MAG: hypothetical protein JW889_07430 [Verrucomicrobia bacterium]|nr:hypothetical protein [Verrucomicrobiota bacterium]